MEEGRGKRRGVESGLPGGTSAPALTDTWAAHPVLSRQWLPCRQRGGGLDCWVRGTGVGGLSEEPTWLCSLGTVAGLSGWWQVNARRGDFGECGTMRVRAGDAGFSFVGVGRPGLDRHLSSGHRKWESRDDAWKAGHSLALSRH